MSRTKHHMSRGRQKGGDEFWSRRPGSNAGGCSVGPEAKRITHRLERREAVDEIRQLIRSNARPNVILVDRQNLEAFCRRSASYHGILRYGFP